MIHYRAVKFVCTFLFFTFIVDVALWSTQLQRVSALVTFHIKNQTVSFHTQDPFQVRVPVYIYEGVLIQAEFDDSEDCVLKFEPNSPVVANNTQAIISIKEKKSYKQGCETMVKAVEAVVQLGKQFESSGGPSIVAVLYLLDFKKGNVPGAPRDTKYTVRGLSFSNGAPPIHTALMPESQFEEVIPKPKKQTEPIMVLLQQEPGPWNDVFLAGEFIAYTYVLMGVTIIFVIRSLVILAGIVRSGKYPTKMRIAIYVSAFIGAILFIATLPMNPFTEGYQLIYRIMELFLVISFHLLILLWHHFIKRMNNRRHITVFKYIIYISLLAAVVKFIIRTFFPGEGKGTPTAYIVYINRVIGWVMLGIMLLFFIYYGLAFWIKRQECTLNMVTRSALSQVTLICMVCILGVIVSIVEEIMKNEKVWRIGVAPEAVRLVLKDIAPSMRIIAILFVLDVRSKTQTSTSVRSGVVRTPYGVKPSELSVRSAGTGYPDSATIVSNRSRGMSFQPSTQDKDTFNTSHTAMPGSHNNV